MKKVFDDVHMSIQIYYNIYRNIVFFKYVSYNIKIYVFMVSFNIQNWLLQTINNETMKKLFKQWNKKL